MSATAWLIVRSRIFPRSYLREFVKGRTSPTWTPDPCAAERFVTHSDAEEMLGVLHLAGFPSRARMQVFKDDPIATIDSNTGLTGHNLV